MFESLLYDVVLGLKDVFESYISILEYMHKTSILQSLATRRSEDQEFEAEETQ